MTLSEGLSASMRCPSRLAILVHADSGIISVIVGGASLRRRGGLGEDVASDCVPITTQGMSCSQRTGVISGPMRAGEEPLLTNAAASSQEGICHGPSCPPRAGGAQHPGAEDRGDACEGRRLAGARQQRMASPSERRLLGRIPACRASSTSLARTSRIEKAPMAADEDEKRPENAATMMTPARVAPASSEDHSSSAWGSDSDCARDERSAVTSDSASTAGPCARTFRAGRWPPRPWGKASRRRQGWPRPDDVQRKPIAPAILAAIERAHRDACVASWALVWIWTLPPSHSRGEWASMPSIIPSATAGRLSLFPRSTPPPLDVGRPSAGTTASSMSLHDRDAGSAGAHSGLGGRERPTPRAIGDDRGDVGHVGQLQLAHSR